MGKLRANIGQMLGKYAALHGNMRVYAFSLFLALSGVKQGRCGAGGGTKGERGEKEVNGDENGGNEQGFEGFREAFEEVISGRMV